ncbi:MAG: glycosyltransferase family 2 protein [Pseudomonadota bacterium]
MKRSLDDKSLTIIVPVFNEERNIPILLERLKSVLLKTVNYEVLFIDDGSTDDTLAVIKTACHTADNVYYVSFSRNYGHQNALKAGIDCCRGDIIVSLDGDLQHPPELIPEMLCKWEDGFDVVYTCRQDSDATGLFKKMSANLFYRSINKISKIQLKPGVADFRLIDKRALISLRAFNEHDLFFRGIIASIGFKQAQIDYIPGNRIHGSTKYSLRKMLDLAVSGITGFSIFPLRILALAGFLFSFCSIFYGLYALAVRLFTTQAVPGWASIMAGIFFLGGLQLAAIGICGEYIGKIFLEVKQRPHYIISECNLPDFTNPRSNW